MFYSMNILLSFGIYYSTDKNYMLQPIVRKIKIERKGAKAQYVDY